MVTAIHDGTADLDVRGKRMRASVRDLRVVGGARGAGAGQCACRAAAARDESADLNVIGCTVDEAITRGRAVSRRIAAYRSARSIRFIHGYGTGQLKRALDGLSPAASAGRPRSRRRLPEQGGGGVTVWS